MSNNKRNTNCPSNETPFIFCGEHLSRITWLQAFFKFKKELNVAINEFTVLLHIELGTSFGHKWYLAADEKLDKVKTRHIRCKVGRNQWWLCHRKKCRRPQRVLWIDPLHNGFMITWEDKAEINKQNFQELQNQTWNNWEDYIREKWWYILLNNGYLF